MTDEDGFTGFLVTRLQELKMLRFNSSEEKKKEVTLQRTVGHCAVSFSGGQ